jgi:VanZ family protein
VSKIRAFAKYWLPVLLWAVVMASASGDTKSVQHSSRIIEPLVRWLFPDISDRAVQTAVLVSRKGAHLTEYAIFALILWRALQATAKHPAPGWPRRLALGAWFGAVGFAVTDELHQVFVPGRQGSPWDVLIDSVGAAGGLLVLWLIGRWRKYW